MEQIMYSRKIDSLVVSAGVHASDEHFAGDRRARGGATCKHRLGRVYWGDCVGEGVFWCH